MKLCSWNYWIGLRLQDFVLQQKESRASCRSPVPCNELSETTLGAVCGGYTGDTLQKHYWRMQDQSKPARGNLTP
ncbi:Hypothetical predicted protein [Podarcis lilfordi]|uniref:Uncharacterized protein n=1 Tax=Podarcis lilfordi TaxID=74358 RepID=A0AA35KJS4_9SAUR|nr:Hypothetical predicted protein [Podarcis lilfordi]